MPKDDQFEFVELDYQDVLHLQRLRNMFGKSRVIGWLRGKTVPPLRYEFEDDFDEDEYFDAMADHYTTEA